MAEAPVSMGGDEAAAKAVPSPRRVPRRRLADEESRKRLAQGWQGVRGQSARACCPQGGIGSPAGTTSRTALAPAAAPPRGSHRTAPNRSGPHQTERQREGKRGRQIVRVRPKGAKSGARGLPHHAARHTFGRSTGMACSVLQTHTRVERSARVALTEYEYNHDVSHKTTLCN
jgi:hypothetical protein